MLTVNNHSRMLLKAQSKLLKFNLRWLHQVIVPFRTIIPEHYHNVDSKVVPATVSLESYSSYTDRKHLTIQIPIFISIGKVSINSNSNWFVLHFWSHLRTFHARRAMDIISTYLLLCHLCNILLKSLLTNMSTKFAVCIPRIFLRL